MKTIISATVAVMALAAMSAPVFALVPFNQSNFYNEKCDTIANVNADCTVQSLNPTVPPRND